MKNLPTLKGVFPEPRPPPKKNFLKENKLKLKDLQKMNLQRSRDSGSNGNCTTIPALPRPYHQSKTEMIIERSGRSMHTKRTNSGCSCMSRKSISTNLSTKPMVKNAMCDRSVQTDDILDKEFLNNALKKCPSRKQTNMLESPSPCDEIHSILDRYENHLPDVQLAQSHEQQPDVQQSHNRRLDNEELLSELKLDDRSLKVKQTYGTGMKLSNKEVGLLGCGARRQIKIPKYLEKEKREKELQRQRELEKDPDCPDGHYVLSDEQRKDALDLAEKKFRYLVNELNKMPMTTETLKIRRRKVEIEKELADLEKTIRTYSKQKIYVKHEVND